MSIGIEIVEVYEVNTERECNQYLQKHHWILLEVGTRYNEITKENKIYYSLGRPKGVSNERW